MHFYILKFLNFHSLFYSLINFKWEIKEDNKEEDPEELDKDEVVDLVIVEEKAVEIKDLVMAVLEETPEILPEDPIEIPEEVAIEIQETEIMIKVEEESQEIITAEEESQEVTKEMNKRNQEILMANWWITGSRVEKVKIKVIIYLIFRRQNVSSTKVELRIRQLLEKERRRKGWIKTKTMMIISMQ